MEVALASGMLGKDLFRNELRHCQGVPWRHTGVKRRRHGEGGGWRRTLAIIGTSFTTFESVTAYSA